MMVNKILNTIGSVSDFYLDNLVIETHAGFSTRTGEAKLGLTWNSDKSTNPEDFISNSNFDLANGKISGADLTSNPHIAKKMDLFRQLTNKLTDGGNLIFGACIIGATQAGLDFGKNMNTFTGGRINIFLAQQLVEPRYKADQSGQRFPHFALMFGERFTWIQRNGETLNRYITLNAVIGQPPVRLDKQK